MKKDGHMFGVSVVSIDGKGLMITGPPGSGKSSLALHLIDRGAILIGDDGVSLVDQGTHLFATPPINIAGKLEIRGLGIVTVNATSAPLALVLKLDPKAPRYPNDIERCNISGYDIPSILFRGGDAIQAIRAEWAMRMHSLRFKDKKHG